MIFGASRSRPPRASARSARRAAAEPVDVEELPPKLVPTLRQLVATAFSLAHTRLALAGLELEEELQRLVGAVVLGLVSVVFAFLALIVGTFTIVAAVPPEHRVLTMVIITVVYLAIAVVAVLRVKGLFTNRPPIFGATLAELEKDKETLRQMARAHEAAEEASDRDRARRDREAFAETRSSSATSPQGAI